MAWRVAGNRQRRQVIVMCSSRSFILGRRRVGRPSSASSSSRTWLLPLLRPHLVFVFVCVSASPAAGAAWAAFGRGSGYRSSSPSPSSTLGADCARRDGWRRGPSAPRATADASGGAAPSAVTKTPLVDDPPVHPSEYLARIGFSRSEIESVLSNDHVPTLDGLQRLLTAHLLTVPFENLDQHDHPPCSSTAAASSSSSSSTPAPAPAVPRRPIDALPSLDVSRSLRKIVHAGRGGFCFELNPAFCHLLRDVGYRARLVLADVGCQQAVPAHVVVLVDGLVEESSSDGGGGGASTHLVDVGFGLPGVCSVVLPLRRDERFGDGHGDFFRFGKDDDGKGGLDASVDEKAGTDADVDPHPDRFDTVLYRTRMDNPTIEEPMYRFHSEDDIADLATQSECVRGLDRVLTTSPTFTGKRICVLSTGTEGGGHVTLGTDYVKWVERWETVRRVELPTETEWRGALEEHFGVRLVPP